MKSPPRTPLPDLERRQGEPLYRQIYRRFRDAIEQGLLAPGDRVASARSLASELGVARGTVDLAYSQLMGEGYFLARGQAGTVVSPRLPAAARMPRRPAQAAMAPAPGVAAMHGFDAAPPPFQLGMPALDAFPRKQWLRLAARRLRALSPADMAYGDPAGYWPLRQAIAAYLSVSAARLVNRGRSSSRRAIGPVWHCWRARCWRPAIRSGWKNRVSRRLARFWSVTAAVSCRCRSMAKV